MKIHKSKVVYSITQGKRTILGTDWPIESFVSREMYGDKLTGWLATYSLCNGVSVGSKRFKTKAEAITSITTPGI